MSLVDNLRTARLVKEPHDGIWVEYQHEPGEPWVTVDWATVQEAIKESDVKIADLQAIVDKLPKTADGVPVVPEMDLYYPASWGMCESYTAMVRWVGDNPVGSGFADSYSTREAAQAARKE